MAGKVNKRKIENIVIVEVETRNHDMKREYFFTSADIPKLKKTKKIIKKNKI